MSDPLTIAAKPASGASLVAPGTLTTQAEPQATETTATAVAATNAAAAPADGAAVSFELGTTIGATLVAATPGGSAMAGARFELRLGTATTVPAESNVVGTIALNAAGDTIVETAIGTLALDDKLALPVGTAVRFQALAAGGPDIAELPPSQASGWVALDQTLSALDKSAPELAQQLRSVLAPATAPSLAATLLFMAGALYSGKWPGQPVLRALGAAGQDPLKAKLGDDLAGLRRLGADGTTGHWQVLTVPLLFGAAVEPVRLYLRRKENPVSIDPAGQRFVIEAELSRLGALQLDGLVRGNRLDLVLRTHAALPQSLRDDASALFRQASAAAGYRGDIVFATAPIFAVDPLTGLRQHVAVQI